MMPQLPEEQMARIDAMVAEAFDRVMRGIGVAVVQAPVSGRIEGTRFAGPLSADYSSVEPVEVTWDGLADVSNSVGERLAASVEDWSRRLAQRHHTVRVAERPHVAQATQGFDEEIRGAPLKFVWIAWIDLETNVRSTDPLDAPGRAIHVR